MLQFWLRKRSTKKHEAKVQDIRRQVSKQPGRSAAWIANL
jgi:hypothetical protein